MREKAATEKPLVTFTYYAANLAKSTSNGSLAHSGTSTDAVNGAVMPWSGSVVGIAVSLNANKTAGTLSFSPTINGVVTTMQASVANSASVARATAPVGRHRFAAGARLGCVYNSNGSMAPDGSLDVAVEVYVQFDGVKV